MSRTSSAGSISPTPMKFFQTRLTMAWAKCVLRGEVSQSAKYGAPVERRIKRQRFSAGRAGGQRAPQAWMIQFTHRGGNHGKAHATAAAG